MRTLKTKTAILKERRDGWWSIVTGSYRGIPATTPELRKLTSRHNEVQVSEATIRKYSNKGGK